jgi:hypothetical protein
MHQQMTTDELRVLQKYERGTLTLVGMVQELIEMTVEPPTAEFVGRLPTEATDRIRKCAAMPPDTEWFIVASCCTADEESWEAAKRESLGRWLRGLALWRAYFGFSENDR